MVKIGFTKEMEKLLSTLKGQQLIPLEHGKDPIDHIAYGNLCLHFEKVSLEISNEEHPFPFFDTVEDLSCFSCQKLEKGALFRPFVVVDPISMDIHKTVTGITIIRDRIDVNHGEYEMEIDQALILHTTEAPFMLSKGLWWDEKIVLARNADYEKQIPRNQIIDDLSEDREILVSLTRSEITL